MENILRELKENHFAVGLKSEFETEGASYDDAFELSKFARALGFKHIIKIGGAAAVKEMYEAKNLGADVIVAPMIETPYALQKFQESLDEVFAGDENGKPKPDFFINVETKTAIENFNEILEDSYLLSGVVLGRNDLARSIGTNAETEEISELAKRVLLEAKNHNLKTVIGGSILPESYGFLREIKTLDGFETRKVVFNAEFLKQKNAEQNYRVGICKALEFELAWLKSSKGRELRGKKRIAHIEKIIAINFC